MSCKVSVIIPVYNVKEYLRDCIDSVIHQSYTNLEIILVDDGSTDGSQDICDEYECKDHRIFVVHKNNGGLSDARNTGLNIASGEFVYFLDSDDLIEEYAIESLVNFAESNKLDVVLFDAKVIDEKGQQLTQLKYVMRYYRIGNYQNHRTGRELFASMISNKEHYSAVPLLFIRKASLKYEFEKIFHEDELFTIQLLYSTNNAGYYPESLYIRRIRQDSIMTMSKTVKHYLGMCSVIEGILNIENIDYALIRYICTLYQCLYVIYRELTSSDRKKVKARKNQVKKLLKEKHYFYNYRLKMIVSLIWLYPLVDSCRRNAPDIIRAMVSRICRYPQYVLRIKELRRTKDVTRIFIIGTPTHGNLGDHAIAIAENILLSKYIPAYKCVEIEMEFYNACKRAICHSITERDLVIISGGGWLGNQWFHNEKMVREIVSKLSRCRIIIFPQTIYYQDTSKTAKQIKDAESVYSKHNKLLICLRDKQSFNFAVSHHLGQCLYAPDIALSLDIKTIKKQRSNILLCKRSDCEKTVNQQLWNELYEAFSEHNYNVWYTDTVIANVPIAKRESAVQRKLEEFSRAKLVITDRLHAMIFAALTGTPCIAFDNTSKKVSGVYSWIKHLEYIRFVKDKEEVYTAAAEMLNSSKEYCYVKPDFSMIEKIVSEIGTMES